MEQVLVNGGNQVFPAIPAGAATKNIAGGAAFTLTSNEAAADCLILAGALAGNVTLTIPQNPQNPNVVGTPGPTFLSGSLLANSWIKLIQDNTTVAHTITLQAIDPSTGLPGTTLALTVGPGLGKTQLVFSPDGINIFAAGPET